MSVGDEVVSVDELIDRFEREYQDYHAISAKRARQQRALIRNYSSTVVGDFVGGQNAASLSAFAGSLIAAGLHVNTVRKKLNMLRAFFSWEFAAGVIDPWKYMELKGVKNPRGSSGKTTPKPYNRTEIQRFWVALDTAFPKLPAQGPGSRAIQRWKDGKGPWGRVWRHAMRLQLDCMVRLALDLGLRAGEIYELSVDDLHYDNDYIVIRGKADPNTGQPKIRKVPYTKEARLTIYHWLEFRALIVGFPGIHDRPWISCWAAARANPMWRSRFDTLLQDSIGDGWAWHRFRHTCATEWLRAEMPLEKVSRLLGHASLQQTLCYAEILGGDLQTAVDRHEGNFEQGVGQRAA